MTEVEKAWLAGLFDGEGCAWSRWPKRSNVHAEIKMSHKPTVEKVNSLFPGSFVKGQLSGLNIRSQWRWRLDTKRTKEFLSLILPYLVTKRREAELAIRLCDRSGQENRDELARELKEVRAFSW